MVFVAGCASSPAPQDAAPQDAGFEEPIERHAYEITDLVAGKAPIPRPGCCVLMAPPVRRIEFPGVRVLPLKEPAPPIVPLPEPRLPYMEYPEETLLHALRDGTGIREGDPRGYRLTVEDGGHILAVCPASLHERIEELLAERRSQETPGKRPGNRSFERPVR